MGIEDVHPHLSSSWMWIFARGCSVTPILVIVQSIRRYRLAKSNKEIFTFRAVAALSIWLVLTPGVLLLLGMLAYVISEAMAMDPSVKPHPAGGNIVLHLIYLSACYLLVDWVSRRRGAKPS